MLLLRSVRPQICTNFNSNSLNLLHNFQKGYSPIPKHFLIRILNWICQNLMKAHNSYQIPNQRIKKKAELHHLYVVNCQLFLRIKLISNYKKAIKQTIWKNCVLKKLENLYSFVSKYLNKNQYTYWMSRI